MMRNQALLRNKTPLKEAAEPFGRGKRSRALTCSLASDRGHVRLDIRLLLEPADELAGDRAGGLEQLLADDHLAHHEIAEELAEMRRDLLRAEQMTERLLIASVERLLPALGVSGAQRGICVRVQAVAQQPDHVRVIAVRPLRQPQSLVAQEHLENVIDRLRLRHRGAQSTRGGAVTAT